MAFHPVDGSVFVLLLVCWRSVDVSRPDVCRCHFYWGLLMLLPLCHAECFLLLLGAAVLPFVCCWWGAFSPNCTHKIHRDTDTHFSSLHIVLTQLLGVYTNPFSHSLSGLKRLLLRTRPWQIWWDMCHQRLSQSVNAFPLWFNLLIKLSAQLIVFYHIFSCRK